MCFGQVGSRLAFECQANCFHVQQFRRPVFQIQFRHGLLGDKGQAAKTRGPCDCARCLLRPRWLQRSLELQPVSLRNCFLTVLICFSLIACRSSSPIRPQLSLAVFTPDGLGIAFSHTLGERCYIYTAVIATGAMSRLTQLDSTCEVNPVFSTDGNPYGEKTGTHLFAWFCDDGRSR